MAVNFESLKNTLLSDPRYLATPTGALAGMLAVRALAPKERRSAGLYALGAAGGGAAGYGLGTYLKERLAEPDVQKRHRQAYNFMQDEASRRRMVEQAAKDPAAKEMLSRAARSATHSNFQQDSEGKPRSPVFFSETPLAKEELETAMLAYGDQSTGGVLPAGAVTKPLLAGAVAGSVRPVARMIRPTAEFKARQAGHLAAVQKLQQELTEALAKGNTPPPSNFAAGRLGLVDRMRQAVGGAKSPAGAGRARKVMSAPGRAAYLPALAGAGAAAVAGGVERMGDYANRYSQEYLGWKNRRDYIADLLRGKSELMNPEEVTQWQQALSAVESKMNRAQWLTQAWRVPKFGG